MSTTPVRTLGFKVTEKFNPFMSKSGVKNTQTRPSASAEHNKMHAAQKAQDMGMTKMFGQQWNTWSVDWEDSKRMDSILRSNISRLMNEEGERQAAFRQLRYHF